MKLTKNDLYLLLIDEEAEIKDGDIVYRDTGIVFKITNENISYYKEVIPKTVHKIYRCISYYPLTKEAKELDLLLLPNPFEKVSQSYKQFSLEDMIAFGKKCFYKGFDKSENDDANSFTAWREEYSKLIQSLSTQQLPVSFEPKYEANIDNSPYTSIKMNKALKALKESSKIGCKLKTITNSEGKEELVGTYKY